MKKIADKLVGIDGCKYGWVAVSLSDQAANLFESIEELIKFYPENSIFMIDIPVGLPDADFKVRDCEMVARRILSKERKSSLFSVPCRESVYALSYEDANQINKEVLNKGISKQSWGIVPKIREVDELIQNDKRLIRQIIESHPEVAFHYLNNQESMKNNKKTEMGQQERLRVLSIHSDKAEPIFKNSMKTFKRNQVSADDILDSICLAVTLEKLVCSDSLFENGTLDSLGIPMKIHYFTLNP